MSFYKITAGLTFLFLLIISNVLSAEDSSDVRVTVSPIPGSNLVEFRCETTVSSSLGSVVSMFEDTDSMPDWVYRMKEAKTLKRINPQVVIAYTVVSLPWPFEDRDSILYTVISQSSDGIMRIDGTDYSDFLTPLDGIVRMRRVRSSWQFEPLQQGRLHVVFTGTGDPGGVIPLSIFNTLVREAPYQTMKKFREVIQRKKYKGAVLSLHKRISVTGRLVMRREVIRICFLSVAWAAGEIMPRKNAVKFN